MFGGIREICNIKLAPLASVDFGNQHFDAFQPMLYIDSAKTSSLEQAATTVYATGGRGNSRLVAWEGEKTLNFIFEDSLLSPESLAMLSGAGVLEGAGALDDANAKKVYVHMTYDLVTEKVGDKVIAKLSADERDNAVLVVTKEAPVYAWTLNGSGRQEKPLPAIVEGKITVEGAAPSDNVAVNAARGEIDAFGRTIVFELDPATVGSGQTIRIDCYIVHTEGARELIIKADNFAGYYYIEAETLMRDEETGVDVPVEFIIPRAKIQSNFTLSMAATGDPSTFTFTVDCMPGYTKFNKVNKVLACTQFIEAARTAHDYSNKTINGHVDRESDADVDTWYSKSIFEDGEAGAEEDPTPVLP